MKCYISAFERANYLDIMLSQLEISDNVFTSNVMYWAYLCLCISKRQMVEFIFVNIFALPQTLTIHSKQFVWNMVLLVIFPYFQTYQKFYSLLFAAENLALHKPACQSSSKLPLFSATNAVNGHW